LGPDEIDPDDPDLWDWDAVDDERAGSGYPRWIRITAFVGALLLALALVTTWLR
jgi:hypothetical protein